MTLRTVVLLRALALLDAVSLVLLALACLGVVPWAVAIAAMLAALPLTVALRLRLVQLEGRHAAVVRLLGNGDLRGLGYRAQMQTVRRCIEHGGP